MNVYRYGPADGPLVLALHGLTGHGKRWEQLAVEHLPDVRVLAPDLRGHGRSAAAPPWRLESVADEVATLLEPDAPAVVVGHSFGGAVALHLAHRHPALVRALVLLDPAVALPAATVLEIAEAMLASPDYPDIAEARADKLHHAWGDVDSALLEAELAEHLTPSSGGRIGWRTSLPAVTAFWGELACELVLPPAGLPTVLVQATRSQPAVVMPAVRAALAAHLGANLTVREFECDHMIAQARPADVARVIRDTI